MKTIHLQTSQNHMATTFHFTVSCAEDRLSVARAVLEEAHRHVAQLENELTEFREVSPIYQLNHSAPRTRVLVPESTMTLLKLSREMSEATQNAFTCTAKSPGEPSLEWDENAMTVWRNNDGTHVGFGAIGKGFALDQVRRRLAQEGFEDFLLNAGGSSIVISGFSSSAEPWSWGWSWMKDADGDPLGLSFRHRAGLPVCIGVSGLEEKGDHIVNPRSHEKAHALKSALVATNTAAEADALSTALFVSGWEESHDHLQKRAHQPALAVIEKEASARWNGLFQKLWGPITTLLFFLTTSLFADDAIDLSSLGIDDFTPYSVDRNSWWILLPIGALLVVLIHLKNSRPKSQNQTNSLEDKI